MTAGKRLLWFGALAPIGPDQRLSAVMGDGKDLNTRRGVTKQYRKGEAIETGSAYIGRPFNAKALRVPNDARHHCLERIQIGAAQSGPAALVERHGRQMLGSRLGVKEVARRRRACASRRTSSAGIGDTVPSSSCCARRSASSSQAACTSDSDSLSRLKSNSWASSARSAGAKAKALRTRVSLSMAINLARLLPRLTLSQAASM